MSYPVFKPPEVPVGLHRKDAIMSMMCVAVQVLRHTLRAVFIQHTSQCTGLHCTGLHFADPAGTFTAIDVVETRKTYFYLKEPLSRTRPSPYDNQ
jgi:hypothetical protein